MLGLEPFIRIFLRYLILPLALYLGAPEDTAQAFAEDPQVVILFVGIAGGLVELWYWAARKWGRST